MAWKSISMTQTNSMHDLKSRGLLRDGSDEQAVSQFPMCFLGWDWSSREWDRWQLKDFLFAAPGKWSHLTIIFFNWVWFNHQLEDPPPANLFAQCQHSSWNLEENQGTSCRRFVWRADESLWKSRCALEGEVLCETFCTVLKNIENPGGRASKEPARWPFSYCSKCLGVKQPDKVVLKVSQIHQFIVAILWKGKPLGNHKQFSPIWSVIKLLVTWWWSFFWWIWMFAISTSGWQPFLVKYYEWYMRIYIYTYICLYI